MAIVRQYDKRSGNTYVYESTYYWDPVKKQSRSKRTIIGKIDPLTGETVPTKKKEPETLTSNRAYIGSTWLLEQIAASTGITADLVETFGEDISTKVQSLAMFLCCEDTPIYRFKLWSNRHRHPYGKDIPSQRASELFASISPEQTATFFKRQAARRADGEYWAYDTTSISSHSELIEPVEAGYNKEGDDFNQFNLLLLFGENSNLPFYYRVVRGSVPDVSTVDTMIGEAGLLELRKMKYCMDRGFYSKANMDAFYASHSKFLVGGRISLKFVQQLLTAELRESMISERNLLKSHDVYGTTILYPWKTADSLSHRMYVHLYYDPIRATRAKLEFDAGLSEMRNRLESGEEVPSGTRFRKYFDVKRGHGISVKLRTDEVEKAKLNLGWFVLLGNETKTAAEALDIYRNRDVVEKAFGDLKGRLNFRRPYVHTRETLDGKLFVEFIALILLSYIKKHMQDSSLFSKYTMAELLDELELIESIEKKGKVVLDEITKKQLSIFDAMGVDPPTAMLRKHGS
jgi:transposase